MKFILSSSPVLKVMNIQDTQDAREQSEENLKILNITMHGVVVSTGFSQRRDYVENCSVLTENS